MQRSVCELWLWILPSIVACYVSPLTAAERPYYALCARSPDPPTCLVRLASARSDTASSDFVEATIATGALELVPSNPKSLVHGAKAAATSADKLLRAPGIEGVADVPGAQTTSSSNSVLLAAVALATAAQRESEPFDNPLVKTLSRSAGDSAAIPPIAAMLWMEADTYGEWASELTRPPGLHRIWSAIVAAPPDDSNLLVDLATSGEFRGHARSEALELLRLLSQRPNAPPRAKAAAASVFARRYGMPTEAQRLLDNGGAGAKNYDIDGIRVEIAEATLRGGYDEHAARTVVESALNALTEEAYQSYLDSSHRDALEAAGAKAELRALGDAYVRRGSEAVGDAEDRGKWFALASDCYRRAGERELALAAARKGLPFVASAVMARNRVLERAPANRKPDSRQQAVRANGFGSEPVLALYRAGGTIEALRFGYLTGFDRFRNARLAGEAPDVQWVIDDRSDFYLRIVVRELVWTGAAQEATDLYGKLTTRAHTSRQLAAIGASESVLARLAALSGSADRMTQHLARAAAALDDGSPDEANAYFALRLAEDWRNAQAILRHALKNPRSVQQSTSGPADHPSPRW